jgi:signal transduction histidine kinase/CheY-like chemotaxis protein
MSNLYPASAYKSSLPWLDRFRRFDYLSNIKGFKHLKIGRKLDLGIGILVTLMFLVVGSIFGAGRQATKNINLTGEVRVPAALASAQARSSLLEMQASMRGYLILSDLNSIDTYNKAKAVFEINLAQLERLSAEWAGADDIRRLEELKAFYQVWSPIPERLFQLHQNPLENQPALRIYSLDYQPTNAHLLTQINDIIQFQEQKESLTAVDRELLADITELETSFRTMATNLRAYVTSGDVTFKFGYAESLDANIVAWRNILARQAGLDAEQQTLLTAIAESRTQLLIFPLQIFEAVEGRRTYEDLYLFKTEVEPQAKQMLRLLNELTSTQQALLQTDLNAGRQSLNVAQQQTLIGGFLALILGIVMAYVFRGHIVKPIQRLTNTAEQITAGDFTAQAQVETRDEIGQLAATINTMTAHLRETIDRLAKLYHMSQGMMSAGTLSELIAVVVEEGNIPVINRAVLNVFEYDEAGEVEAMVVAATWYSGAGPPPSRTGTRYRRSINNIINIFLSHEPIFFDDIQQDKRTDPATLAVVQALQIRAMAVLPLWSQGQQVGVLLLQGAEPYDFAQDEIHPYLALLGQLTVAVENRRLFEQIQQRANELAKAKEAAETASHAKSEFLTNMSHELRTPLNGILGYAQILKRDENLSTSQTNAVSIIQKSGEHLLTLINDILDISKIEARKLELDPTDLHLPDFLEGIAGMFQLRAQENPKVRFAYQQLTVLPDTVQADKKRLRQVLINLLSNAFKFTDEGSVTLRVWAKKQGVRYQHDAQSLHYALLHLEIEDTGIGMSPAQLERIFLPFEQVGDIRRRADGTGLGLAITKNLVEAMGGMLEVESTLHQGSILRVYLEFPVLEPVKQPLRSPGRDVVGYHGKRRKILVVDDELHNLAMLTDLLVPFGFEVTAVESGQKSIETLPIFRPDAILMDLIMPEMSGLEAVETIRQLEKPGNLRTVIIATSASVSEEIQLESQEAGCDEFLPKPIEIERLLALLEMYLSL